MAFNLVSAEQIKAINLDNPDLPEDSGFGMTIKVDTAANLKKENPVLLKGQLGAESDTTYMKLGNGTTAWNDLSYSKAYTADSATKAAQDASGKIITDTYETIANATTFMDGCTEKAINKLWKLSTRKFTFNKNNNMGPWLLEIDDSTNRELNGLSDLYPLFSFIVDNDISSDNIIAMSIDYSDTITSSDFNSDGTLYKFMYSHSMQLIRESDGYGLFWSSPYYVDSGPLSGGLLWICDNSCSPAPGISDTNISIIMSNLKTSYDNGENLIMEFIDKKK